MNKKENRMAVRQAAQQAVIRDEQNHRIEHAATNPIKEVLKSLHTTLRGLDAENIVVSRTKYGTNKVTHEKKQSLAKRLAGAFINPFTAILFCLAVVSTMTDMVFPYFSLLGSSPEDFDPLTDYSDHGYDLRYASFCTGIQKWKCSRKTVIHDHNYLHRHKKRTGKN